MISCRPSSGRECHAAVAPLLDPVAAACSLRCRRARRHDRELARRLVDPGHYRAAGASRFRSSRRSRSPTSARRSPLPTARSIRCSSCSRRDPIPGRQRRATRSSTSLILEYTGNDDGPDLRTAPPAQLGIATGVCFESGDLRSLPLAIASSEFLIPLGGLALNPGQEYFSCSTRGSRATDRGNQIRARAPYDGNAPGSRGVRGRRRAPRPLRRPRRAARPRDLTTRGAGAHHRRARRVGLAGARVRTRYRRTRRAQSPPHGGPTIARVARRRIPPSACRRRSGSSPEAIDRRHA